MDGDKSSKTSSGGKGGGIPISKVYEVEDVDGGKNEDKLDKLIKKWQKETRDEIKKRGEAEFDFMSADP